ncbi:MAG: hypothetical protein HQK79_12535 [Desulfobacterales bacterium]|nr:hypothetical protein [Desulfobacterales bacterium]
MKKGNRRITGDFKDEIVYYQLIQDGNAFIEFIIAIVMSFGFQLKHKYRFCGGFSLTRHSHYVRAQINDVAIWRIQSTKCKEVFTIPPHFVH